MANVTHNGASPAIQVLPYAGSVNINGVPRVRLQLFFEQSAGGATFALNTANIPSGNNIRVNVLAFLPDYS